MRLVPQPLDFDDVAVGQEWESESRTVTQDDILEFAALSGDQNPIHVDPAFARSTPFRRPIAHGLLVFSFAGGLTLTAPPLRTLAFMAIRDWQFKAPVFIGDTIRVRRKVVEKEARARGRRGVIVWHMQILNQDGKVVQEGVTLTLVEGRAAANKAA